MAAKKPTYSELTRLQQCVLDKNISSSLATADPQTINDALKDPKQFANLLNSATAERNNLRQLILENTDINSIVSNSPEAVKNCHKELGSNRRGVF